ncbi:MAG TPA: ABC transporter permease [Dongiaceae bacterium]|nr:ABC transporter permease [Dongiaceae bacterium]
MRTPSPQHRRLEQGSAHWLQDLIQDLRLGARQLRKNPGFTAVAALTLALGIGASTAIFSLVNALLLRPLPFHEPERLVWIANREAGGAGGLSTVTTQVSVFADWRSQNRSFESLAGYFAFFDYRSFTLTSDGEPVRLQGVSVSQNFLDTLGVRPQRGRNFVAEECQWNGRKAVLLTHAFWKRRFHGDPAILGRTLTLNNEATEVVGILPPAFDFSSIFSPGSKVDLVLPFPICPETDSWGNTLAVLGRLKRGITLQAAQQEFDVLNRELKKDHPARGDVAARMTPLPQQVSGQFRRSFLVLSAAVLGVLLIACANVSNLLLARAAVRRKEIAVRMALGAGRSRIVRQMLTESLLMSGLGASLGLSLAFLATAALARSHAFNLPLLPTVAVDTRALGFALLIGFAAGLFCGIIPVLQLFATDIHGDLKDASRGSGYGARRVRAREALVLVEVATSFVLLVGAGLLLHSFLRLLEVNPGFRPEQAAAWPIQPSRGFTNPTEQAAFYRDLIQRAEALPGVVSAGLSDTLPLGRNRFWITRAKGRPYREGDGAFPRIVDAGYIRTLGIPLRSGREFNLHDTAETEKVILINEAMAHKLWPGESALGQIVRTAGLAGATEYRVVGVVGNVRHSALEEDGGPEVYLLGVQAGWSAQDLVVRTKGSLASLVPAVRAVLRQTDPAMPVDDFKPLGQIVEQAVAPKRLITILVGLFSLLALALASVGIYGVVAYSVSQRTGELGVRLALGATSRDIVGLVIRQGMKPVVLGLLLGVIGSWWLTRLMQSLLYGVGARDPLTFVANVLLLAAIGLLACWGPARRAARVDPLVALRDE